MFIIGKILVIRCTFEIIIAALLIHGARKVENITFFHDLTNQTFFSTEESQSDEAVDNLERYLACPGDAQHHPGPCQLQLCQRPHQHRQLDLGCLCLPCRLRVQVRNRAGGGGDKTWNNSSKNFGILSFDCQAAMLWLLLMMMRWTVEGGPSQGWTPQRFISIWWKTFLLLVLPHVETFVTIFECWDTFFFIIHIVRSSRRRKIHHNKIINTDFRVGGVFVCEVNNWHRNLQWSRFLHWLGIGIAPTLLMFNLC